MGKKKIQIEEVGENGANIAVLEENLEQEEAESTEIKNETPETLPFQTIWLRSPGGVEYLIDATDHGLAVVGRGKVAVLCGDESPHVDLEPEKQSNRNFTFKPKG